MVLALDAKDRAILLHLDEDSRQPVSSLAKKVHLNREVVRYRIERMEREGVIQKFMIFVPMPRLGYYQTTLFMRFQDTSAKDEEGIIGYLKGKTETVWIGSSNGRFDLGFTVAAKNVMEVYDFVSEFRERYGHFTSDVHMASIVTGVKLPRRYLSQERTDDERAVKDIESAWNRENVGPITLDETDRKVLMALGQDGRMRAVDIAKKVGISADAVADRIAKLEKKGAIHKKTILIDPNAMGRKLFRSFITFHKVKNIEKRFIDYCYENRCVVQVKRMLGPWEYEVDLELESEEQLREMHSKFKEHFSEAVRSTSFITIYRVHKFDMAGFLGR